MKTKYSSITATLLFTLCLAPVTAQTSAQASPVAQHPEVIAALRVLDAWIEATAAQREQPGLSIGIVYDQNLMWAKGYGFADLERRRPATPATLYRIASISKLFTATAIMQLRDQGRLRLDDPVRDRLPWFTVEKTDAADLPITIRQVLTHTSGLPRNMPGVNWNPPTFPGQSVPTERLPPYKAVFPPATRLTYSNLGYTVAGAVIGRVSGDPWAAYIERHLLKPLGMTATGVAQRRDGPDFAVGYSRRVPGQPRELEPFVDTGDLAAAGAIASNVEDLAKFVSLQFRTSPDDARAVVRGSTLREMHRVQWLHPDWQGGYGLGFRVRRIGGHVRVGHGGDLPGYKADIDFAPDLKLGVIALANADDGDPWRYVEQAFKLLAPAVAQATKPPPTRREIPASWAAYEGLYESLRCETCAYKFEELRIQVLNGELTIITPDAEDPWSSRVILVPVDAHTFTLESPGPSFAQIGERLTFEVDETGRVRRMKAPYSVWVPKQ